jgi:hypothetical protein
MNNNLDLKIGECHISGTAFAFGNEIDIKVYRETDDKPELRRFKINAFDPKKSDLRSIPIVVELRGSKFPDGVIVEHGKHVGLGNARITIKPDTKNGGSELVIKAKSENCFIPNI